MITGLRRAVLSVTPLAVILCVSAAGCERSPLLAPAGSTITLISSATTVAPNGTTTLTAQVIEPAGTVPHSGTIVIFTTTLGTIEPTQAQTDVNGQARVKFTAGSSSGVATILASSGGAAVATENALKITIGTAAVAKLTLSANPAAVASGGGSTTITATAVDSAGNGLAGVEVSFTTDFGTVFPSVVTSDSNGRAQATLATTVAARVTATAGDGTVTATLSVSVTQ